MGQMKSSIERARPLAHLGRRRRRSATEVTTQEEALEEIRNGLVAIRLPAGMSEDKVISTAGARKEIQSRVRSR